MNPTTTRLPSWSRANPIRMVCRGSRLVPLPMWAPRYQVFPSASVSYHSRYFAIDSSRWLVLQVHPEQASPMRSSFPSQCAVASQASASYTSAGLVNGVFSFERKLFSFLVSSSRRPLSARDPWCLEASEATVPTRALIRYYGKRWWIEERKRSGAC